MKKHLPLFLAAVSAFAGTASLSAATVLNPGATFNTTSTNWSNGAPGTGNDGTINANYTIGGNVFLSAGTYSVTQTAGIGTGSQFNYVGGPGINFTFNLQGGSINSTSQTFFVNATTTNVSGGSLSATGNFTLGGGGVFNISGGTVSNTGTIIFGTNSTGANVLSLTGGTVSGTAATSLLWSTNLAATIGGSAIVNAAGITSFGITTSTLNFTSGWTGSLNLSSATDWSAALINSGATLNGADITASNINQFAVTGGQISFAAVPEPSTYGLLGAGALAGVAFVRRRRKTA